MGQIINNIGGNGIFGQLNGAPGDQGNFYSQPAWQYYPDYRENFNLDTNEARARIFTSWDNMVKFPTFMLGDVESGGGNLKRTLPQSHPTRAGLFCAECNLVKGEGAWRKTDAGMIEFYDSATGETGASVWDVTWRRMQYDLLEDDIIQSELERFVIRPPPGTTVEPFALPSGSGDFVWQKDLPKQVPIPEGIALQRPIQDVVMTWVWVPDSVVRTLQSQIWPTSVGTVNADNDPFDGLYAKGHALMLAPQVSPLKHTPSGARVRDITYHFMVRLDYDWNTYYRRGGGFQQIVGKPNAAGVPGDPPYKSSTFAQLFRVP